MNLLLWLMGLAMTAGFIWVLGWWYVLIVFAVFFVVVLFAEKDSDNDPRPISERQ